MKPNTYLFAAAIFLIAGTANYYLFNPDIVLFEWLRMETVSLPAPVFVKGYLSDLCWCLAFCLALRGLVVMEKLNSLTASFLLIVPAVTEFLQLAQVLPGTFDPVDLLAFCALAVIFLLNWWQRPAGKFQLRAIPFAAVFMLMTLACVSSKPPAPKPLPCVTHKALGYSPVLVTMYISGSYNMKDLSEAQRLVPAILMDKMNSLNPYKYKFADGVTPNLSLYVTYTTDSYGHFGAEIKGYVYDGDFYSRLESNYVTWEKLDSDIAAKVNSFISYGWCSNCPLPCNP